MKKVFNIYYNFLIIELCCAYCYFMNLHKDHKILRIEDVLDYPVVFIDEVIYNDVKCGKMIDDIYNISDKVIFNYNNKYYSIYKKENNKLVCYINNL